VLLRELPPLRFTGPSVGAQRMAISSQPSAISKLGLSTELFPTQSSALVTHCSLRVRPPAPETGRATWGARLKVVGRPFAIPNGKFQIANLRSAICTSERSEDWESRGAWFDLAHHPELVEGKEVPEALGNRNGEFAIAISPSRTRSKRHLAPHFVTDSL